jgi:hypothetical protein
MCTLRIVNFSTWSGEILTPQTNVVAYQQVYEVETWLRRICLASYLIAEGPAWAATINSTLRVQIEEEVQRNASRWYLGIDADEEMLWSTTQDQLEQLLRRDSLAPYVIRCCGVSGRVLANQLGTIALIRNALAHNRAISMDSLTILDGVLTITTSAIREFKRRILYSTAEAVDQNSGGDLREVYNTFLEGERKFPDQQLFLTANDDFVFFVRLPIEPFDRWPDTKRLYESLGLTRHLLLCILANKAADELQFVVPRRIATPEILQVLKSFMSTIVLSEAWTTIPPGQQNPVYTCWPKLWFYENRMLAM